MRSLLRSSRFRRQVGDAARALNLTNDLVSIVDVAVQDRWPLENVWLGVSTEDQKWADIRIPELLITPRQSDSSPPNHFSVRSSCGRSSYPTRVSAAPRRNVGSGKRRGCRHSAQCSPRAPRRLPRLSRLDHRRRGIRSPGQTDESGLGAFTTRPGRQHRCRVPVQAMGRMGTAHRSSPECVPRSHSGRRRIASFAISTAACRLSRVSSREIYLVMASRFRLLPSRRACRSAAQSATSDAS